MKRILGLDLGNTSIGFAYVKEAENGNEQSSIEKIGVRVNPLTTDEQTNFEKGKPITTNADRTLKRGMRRNLDRYQLRRDNLIEVLKSTHIISNETILAENGKNTTFETWRLRAAAVTEKIEKEDLARVLLAINKKRGYKSSRKAKDADEGQAIDGMGIARRLYEENLTPGQLAYQFLSEGRKHIPDFYRSDLQAEFDKVWDFQRQFYPDIFTDEFYKELQGKGQRATSAAFWTKYQFNTADIKDLEDGLKNEKTIKLSLREKKKLQAYKWRAEAFSKQLTKEEAAYVVTEINNNLNNSSGYLGAISDRSKKLYFNNETVGQYLYKQLLKNPHTRLKNQVFYRQDYLDEFEKIWETQSKYHPELNNELKEEICDIIIFYQRKLKSQKSLISFCEFESREVQVRGKKKTVGLRVVPKSSPLFQEFKVWQMLNNVLIRKKGSRKRTVSKARASLFEEEKEIFVFDQETKQQLFKELNLKGNLSSAEIIKLLGYKPVEWELNYSQLEGNQTNKSLYEAYFKILDLEGYDIKDLLKVKSNKDDVELNELNVSASEIADMVRHIFEALGINTEILEFNAELDGKAFEQQHAYQLWHLLYSYEGDDSVSGNDRLYRLLQEKFGFTLEHTKILANVAFQDDYGSLSTKAMRKIIPHLKAGLPFAKKNEDDKMLSATAMAGYRHSKHSLTKEEIEKRELKPRLELLKKNSLRNPVVEKILNQMVNVVNTLIATEREKDPGFHFDEIRIELARELKKNAKERAEMTTSINAAKAKHETIFKLLQSEFGLANPTRNDIIRYKLYDELRNNGYKDLYTNRYIPREKLFTKEIDIEHIIPQSKAFDNSFSNKILSFRQDNLEKGDRTAIEYIEDKFGEDGVEEFLERIKHLHDLGQKNSEEGISKAKYQKLQKSSSEIGDGFIERDLRESQYIARKAKEMLFSITRSVVSTSGSITGRLREDWDLINLMKELNLPKYQALGFTEMQERKFGQKAEVITDWTKRNDHRHHAMDALTVAFTKQSHIQYLNYLNARKDENHKLHGNIIAIETAETEQIIDKEGNKKRVFKQPIPNFRRVAKDHLEAVLISHKAKNKVVTKNKNKIKTKNGGKVKIESTPRGQLHKETVYGQYRYYQNKEEKVGTKFDLKTIEKVANPLYRKLLRERLDANENDPSKAFAGKNALVKNPIYVNETGLMPEKVKLVWLVKDYSIRKDITPENFKDRKTIEKVVDEGVKRILLNRLEEYSSDPKKAFSDLSKNPIWLNKDKCIPIKRVTISGLKNAEPLHWKKDHRGQYILNENESKIPVDFVSTGNNHHVAIYRDEKGNLQDDIRTFFEVVERMNQGLPIIDSSYNRELGWQFLFTMKQNEMFVFPNAQTGFNPIEIDLFDPKNQKIISPNLFRVQKLSKVTYGNSAVREYVFRHHLETNVEEKKELKDVVFKNIKSLGYFEGIVKVRINHIGQVVQLGEY